MPWAWQKVSNCKSFSCIGGDGEGQKNKSSVRIREEILLSFVCYELCVMGGKMKSFSVFSRKQPISLKIRGIFLLSLYETHHNFRFLTWQGKCLTAQKMIKLTLTHIMRNNIIIKIPIFKYSIYHLHKMLYVRLGLAMVI